MSGRIGGDRYAEWGSEKMSRREAYQLVESAQRRRRRQSLVLYGIVVLALALGLLRGEAADRRIDASNEKIVRNSDNIERVFREQCEQLAGGFQRMNAANADIVVLLESAAAQSTNPEALKRFTDDFRAKQLPIPNCYPPPTVPPPPS